MTERVRHEFEIRIPIGDSEIPDDLKNAIPALADDFRDYLGEKRFGTDWEKGELSIDYAVQYDEELDQYFCTATGFVWGPDDSEDSS